MACFLFVKTNVRSIIKYLQYNPWIDLSMQFYVAVAHLFPVLSSILSYEYTTVVPLLLWTFGLTLFGTIMHNIATDFNVCPGTSVQECLYNIYQVLCLRLHISST